MYLHSMEIKGFRGIHHLALTLEPKQMIVIGENTWGKASCLGALALLSPKNALYQFHFKDFYRYRHKSESSCQDYIEINFVFSENEIDQFHETPYQPFLDVSYRGSDGLNQFTYQIRGNVKDNKTPITEHRFLKKNGDIAELSEDPSTLIRYLIELRPVLRLKNPVKMNGQSTYHHKLPEAYIRQLSEQLKAHTANISDDDLHKGLEAARAVLEYYLVNREDRHHAKYMVEHHRTPTSEAWQSLNKFNYILDKLDNDYIRFTLLGVFVALLKAKDDCKTAPEAIPILLLEEPESHLHPIILSVAINLLNNLPIQKIMTTNSGEILSLSEPWQVKRLMRNNNKIHAYSLPLKTLNDSDLRRIKFHIFYRRPSSLFARTWLLVEGETEIWCLKELATQSGYHLNFEGVQIIDFSQIGLKPLIKFAKQMGINWFVLTDGDTAGKKYADAVYSLCPPEESIKKHLMVLPAKDMENFMFRHGFSHIYKQFAYGTTEHINVPIHRIIQKAIHKISKPDLAVAICDDAKARGIGAIPSLFTDLFAKVVGMSKIDTLFD